MNARTNQDEDHVLGPTRTEKGTGWGPCNNGIVCGGNTCVIDLGSFVQGKLCVVVHLKRNATQLLLVASTQGFA